MMRIQKRRISILAILFALCVITVPVWANSAVELSINNVRIELPKDMGQAFMDKDGRCQIPLRFIIDIMGHEMQWDAKKQEIKIDGGDITLTINNPVIKTPNGSVTMDTVPFLKEGRTFVPIRFVSEALGYEVKYKFVSGVNCVLIYGSKAPTTPGDDYRPGDAPTYKPIPGVTPMITEENKHTILNNPKYIGLNEWNTTLRTPGSSFEEERTYLNTILGKGGVGFAKDGNLAIGNVDSLKDQQTGVAGEFVGIYPSPEDPNNRVMEIRGWIPKSNKNPSVGQIARHNVLLESIRYYSNDNDGKAIIAYLDKAFNTGKAPTFGTVMTFGETKVKFLDIDGFGLRLQFMQ